MKRKFNSGSAEDRVLVSGRSSRGDAGSDPPNAARRINRRDLISATANLPLFILASQSKTYARFKKRQPAFSVEGLESLHEAMAGFVTSGDRPGIVTLLARDEEVHVDAVGTKEIDRVRPLARDTIFRIASTTKPIIGALTMKLVEEGVFRLDDTVDRFIPELANRRVLRSLDGPLDKTVPARRPIEVQDLLTMRMGVGWIMNPGRYPIADALQNAGVLVPFRMPTARSADEWVAKLAALPSMDQPGEVWRYDTSMTTLCVLIERATGEKLGEVLRSRLLEPLSMRDTGFVVPPEKLDRLPTCYQRNPVTGSLEVWDSAGSESFWARDHGFAGAHGGLVSTVDDYLAFARMMLNQGEVNGRRVLSAQSVRAMTTDQVPNDVKSRSPFAPGFWEARGWGYGGAVVKRAETGAPRGFGWDGGYGLSIFWDAKTRLIGMFMSQRLVESPANPEAYKVFWDGLYRAAQP